MADKDTWKEFEFITEKLTRARSTIGHLLYDIDGVDRKMIRLRNDEGKKKSFEEIVNIHPDYSMKNIEKTYRRLLELREWLLNHDLFVDGKV